MKKMMILVCAILMMPVSVNACGGITIKGNSGDSYCLSKHKMNWYSAYAWCRAQGMNLIDLETTCKSDTSCPEFKLSNEAIEAVVSEGGIVNGGWARDSKTEKRPYFVKLRYGTIGADVDRNDGNITICALCQ